jgi:hypothetical protein
MRKSSWNRWTLLALASGAVMLQATGCAEAAFYFSSIANVVTAGGVIYLVSRVIG